MKCLVTKLKGVVNNSNLRLFDAFRVRVNDWRSTTKVTLFNNSTSAFEFGGPGVTIIPISNCYVDNHADKLILPDNPAKSYNLYPTDNTLPSEFFIIGINKITSLWDATRRRFEIQQPHTLKYLQTKDGIFPLMNGSSLMLFGDFSENGATDWGDLLNEIINNHPEINKADIKAVEFGTNNVDSHTDLSDLSSFIGLTSINSYFRVDRGDLSDIANLVGLTALSLSKVSGSKITGDIISLAKCTSLNTLALGGVQVGELKELAQAQYDNGRTTGSIAINFESTTNISFNGVKVDGNHTLTWTSRTDITLT